ncbi:Multicopper oxidase MmcO [Paraburkholderia phenoliruptrix]|jgi:FtsP/CotA-like multicopper oxidase with cupredoxin domain|uniref:Multicopper oxidase MmcO n=1 Tax=Paraburkholderia phenoliruptrix TaxID=252970 RepID=A0A6J5C3W8_9BURK|nr:multicopper oxidase domain-containing protein [Paraburkholderia phenoliruptrix]CAB3724431.1 Multicopper oxidase MmcO [Paraburkholderia phenoliruptrix]
MQNFIDAPFATLSSTWTTSRRGFLRSAFAGAAALALRPALIEPAQAGEGLTGAGVNAPTQLAVVRRTIEVNGRPASVYGIQQQDGTPGLTLREGDTFNVVLRNETGEPTSVHWHGLTPPWPSDGVPDAPLPLIANGAQRKFDFPVGGPGTYWMHAHTLQEQQLLAAPLIVADSNQAKRDEQEVVILLHDFSFTSPQELLARLTQNRAPSAPAQAISTPGAHSAGKTGHDGNVTDDDSMPGMDMSGSGTAQGSTAAMQMSSSAMPMDLNDIDYDAYLANDRTLDDPEVVRVESGGRLRVRVINGATATAFTVDFGELEGTLIAVDGQPVEPVKGRRFPLSMAQRIDVRLQLPRERRAFPILALREGGKERTGIVLQAPGAQVARLADTGNMHGPVLDLALEAKLRAAAPLASRRPSKSFDMALTGDMAAYRWGLEARPRIAVDRGDRVEVTLRNTSMMAHPMHLHGHHFQVVAIDGRRFAGAMRDTVMVPPRRSVTIAVDANNPGQWAFHCHHLYHMATGMMATFAYNA